MKRIPVIKLASIFCALTLALVTLPAISRPATAEDITVCKFDAGNGTETSPYEISTAVQLACLATQTNAGNADFNSQYYLQTQDINLNVYPYNTGDGWTPIGKDSTYPFKGVYDGGGRTISHLWIQGGDAQYPNAGLFGYVDQGTIKNLSLSMVDIYHNPSPYYQMSSVGGFVGTASGSTTRKVFLSNLSILSGVISIPVAGPGGIVGTSSFVDMENLRNNGAHIRSSGATVLDPRCAGGIAGKIESSTLRNAYNFSRVSEDSFSQCAGGIVSISDSSTIINTYNAGSVSNGGGIVGTLSASTVINAYNSGPIQNGAGITYSISYESGSTISAVLNKGEVSGEYFVGGVVAKISQSYQTPSTKISDSVNQGLIELKLTYSNELLTVGGIIGFKASTGAIKKIINLGNVVLKPPTFGHDEYHAAGVIGHYYNTCSCSSFLNVGDILGGSSGTSGKAAISTKGGDGAWTFSALYNWDGVSTSSDSHVPFIGTGTAGWNSAGGSNGAQVSSAVLADLDFWENSDSMDFSEDNWDLTKISQGYFPVPKGVQDLADNPFFAGIISENDFDWPLPDLVPSPVPPAECETGYVGTPPNCEPIEPEPIEECEAGTIGTPPDCEEIQPEPPAECEAGYTGVHPDCVPIVPPPADQCPAGSTGVPPFCQLIPPPVDECPAGSIGVPPFCQLIPPPADKPNDIPPSTSTDSLPSIPIDIPPSTVPTTSTEPDPPLTAISTTLDTQVTESSSECQLEKLICQFPTASSVALAFTDTSKIEKIRRSDIDWLSRTGVTIGSGCDLTQAGGGSNCKYLPANPVNRGAMAQFLQKLAGWTDSQISGTYSGQSSKFTDTAVIKSKNLSRYYAILWLADTGITVGCSATKFCPDNLVNRGAMAEFMQKFAGVSPAPANQSDFPDVSTKAVTLKYASTKKTTKVPALNQNRIGAINWLASTKITVGSGESAGKVTYKPQDLVNRGSMAQFMHRLYDWVKASGAV